MSIPIKGPATYQGARCASRSMSLLHSEDRGALHAELPGSALGVVRDELVFGVVLELHESQTRAFDLRAVGVLLMRASYAGRPKGRVAHDAFGKLLLGNDVRDCKAAAPPEKASGFPKYLA